VIQPSTERKQLRTRRWLSRTLLVLGGTAAATGTAWLVSTAGASAATGEPDLFAGPNQVLDTATVEAVANSAHVDAGHLLADLTELGDQLGLDRTGEAQLPPIADLPDHLREIAARMGFTVPPLELPIVDRPPTGDEQDQTSPLPAAPAPDAAAVSDSAYVSVVSPVPDHDRVLPSVHANDADRRGPPVPDDRDLPLRTAPAGAPAAPGAPSSAGHDSPTYAEPPLADPSSRAVVARAERARDSRLPATPGTAPGTTPD